MGNCSSVARFKHNLWFLFQRLMHICVNLVLENEGIMLMA